MRNLLLFLIKHQFIFLFLILEIVALFLLSYSYSYQRSLTFNAANDLTGNVLKTSTNISDYFLLSEENKQLLDENARLRDRLPNLKQAVAPDSILYVADSIYDYIPAHVIRNTVNRHDNFIILDKGRDEGIEKEMGVLSPQGVAGIVIGVSSHYSIAMSLLNEHAKISARIKKDNQLVNVIWDQENSLEGTVVDIPSHLDLEPGDTVVTSGNSFIFPAGINLGTIVSYHKSENRSLNRAVLKFSTDFNSLHYVYLVRNLRKKEQEKLLEEAER
ncbi:MAG: rod shape-determining protein MreC [Bacteroidales bacterium]|nr:rod shape-determining protein MreC [Bacteroidales bacterium]